VRFERKKPKKSRKTAFLYGKLPYLLLLFAELTRIFYMACFV